MQACVRTYVFSVLSMARGADGFPMSLRFDRVCYLRT